MSEAVTPAPDRDEVSAVARKPVNPWRGERRVDADGCSTVLSTTMDTMARLFDALGVETLGELFDTVQSRRPDRVRTAFLALADADGETVWNRLAGVAGMNAAVAAVLGTISGETPEQEAAAAAKHDAEQARLRDEMIERVVMREVAPLLTAAATSSDGPSPDGPASPPSRLDGAKMSSGAPL